MVEESYLAVDPSAFDFVLINAAKELSTELDQLKEEFKKLQLDQANSNN